MKVFENMSEWMFYRDDLKRQGKTIGFVPTMGALHAGHFSLVEKAKLSNDCSVVSIFVNPTQFNSTEDLEKYPRTTTTDLELLAGLKAGAVLLPNNQQMYNDGLMRFKVIENQTSRILCGAHRPGHFDGVLTVMTKLLGLAQANSCYMGEKDYQQLRLVQDMAESFFFSTQIIGCPTVREESGLAMSSRNQRLSATGRELAAQIYKSISQNQSLVEIHQQLKSQGIEVEYLEEHWGRRFIAAHIEGVRLIDNVEI